MDWLILLFLVPLVLVPIVFLAGFTGCGFQGHAIVPLAPTNLSATAVSTTQIDLAWENTDVNLTGFRIFRSENGGPDMPLTPDVDGAMLSASDMGLHPDTPYEYQIFSLSYGTLSDGSNRAPARTLAVVDLPIAYNVPITTDDPNDWSGSTIVQLIPSGRLMMAATKIRITLRGASAVNLIIDKVFVSQGASPGKVWDPGPDLTEVRSAGNSGATIPAGQTKVMDDMAYALDPTKNLMIAFNINIATGKIGSAAVPTAGMYSKANTAEAQLSPRSANYVTHLNAVYIFEKIEVVA